MNGDNSITRWIRGVREGDSLAAAALWNCYFHRLVGLARKKLRDAPRGMADEEDVVVCAFDSFCRGAEAGRFPRLEDRDDLWQILVMLTARKAVNQSKFETREKRGGGRDTTRRVDFSTEEGLAALDQIVGTEPSPEFAAMLADECRALLERLDDETLRRIAVRKMEGDTNAEIARDLGIQTRTVGRKLQLIRGLWSE